MLGEERSCEIVQVTNDMVLTVCPIGSELERVIALGGLSDHLISRFVRPLCVLYTGFLTRRIGVVFRFRTVADDE